MKKRVASIILITTILLTAACGDFREKKNESSDGGSEKAETTVEETGEESTRKKPVETTEKKPTVETIVENSRQATETSSYVKTASPDEIIDIQSGDVVEGLPDRNYPEGLKVEFSLSNDSITLYIGEAEIEVELRYAFGELSLVHMSNPFGGSPVFMIGTYGEFSDEEEIIFIVYEYGELAKAGTLTSDIYYMDMIDGVLCYASNNYGGYILGVSEDGYAPYALSYVPDGMAPFGLVISVTQDFPVYSFRYGEEVEWMAKTGDQLVISGRDIELMYIQTMDGSNAGWIRCDWDEYNMVLADGSVIFLNDAIYTLVMGG